MKKLDVRVYNLINILHDKEIMAELTREKQMEELTCGEKLVDIKSTKATELDVYKVKRLTAELINHLENKK
ncbi:hypothetical protein QE177_04305 [Arsenophonus sp. aPb]|uniref:hypothetical protein n=1 Tax=Arsenophonus sp. aPb TaxID=3041619 RepID=UPI002469212D|nr:hypothetical protein [Arsenophonus sp. aPb]WGL99112.1 hypothetical protein QE177_04305 [Arsenophonus sp. aPb]